MFSEKIAFFTPKLGTASGIAYFSQHTTTELRPPSALNFTF